MFHLKWSRLLITLAMLLCLFTVGLIAAPSAHAAAGPLTTTTTTTKTSTAKASAQFCAFLQKSLPARAGDAHLCEITIVTTDVVTRETGMQVASFSPNACYPTVISHSARYWIPVSPPTEWATFNQSETFTYNCGPNPVVSGQQCNGWFAPPPFTISQGWCGNYPNGYENAQAEDDVTISSIWGGTIGSEGYSDARPDGSIVDWCSCYG